MTTNSLYSVKASKPNSDAVYQHIKRKVVRLILENDSLIVMEAENELHVQAVKKGL